MPQVQTVRGPVDTAELGQTLMHEHVFVLSADVQQNYPEEWGSEDERVADAVDELRALAAVGRGERHLDAEHLSGLLGDLLEVAALEHDVAQGGVQRVDPRQHVGGGVSGYQHLDPNVGDRWHNLTAAKSNGAR